MIRDLQVPFFFYLYNRKRKENYYEYHYWAGPNYLRYQILEQVRMEGYKGLLPFIFTSRIIEREETKNEKINWIFR